MDLTRLKTELDDFEDFVDSFSSQMNDILSGKIPETLDSPKLQTKRGFELSDVSPNNDLSVSDTRKTYERLEKAAEAAEEVVSPSKEATMLGETRGSNEKSDALSKTTTVNGKKISAANGIDYSTWEHLPDQEEEKYEEQGTRPDTTSNPPPATSNQKSTTESEKKQSVSDNKFLKIAQDHILSLKTQGSSLFKARDFSGALEYYTQAIQDSLDVPEAIFSGAIDPSSPFAFVDKLLRPKHIPVDVTLYTNRALTYIKLCDFENAVKNCDSALALDSSNLKALWRRAEARRSLKQFDLALHDSQKIRGMPGHELLVSPKELNDFVKVIEREKADFEYVETMKKELSKDGTDVLLKTLVENFVKSIKAESFSSTTTRSESLDAQRDMLLRLLKEPRSGAKESIVPSGTMVLLLDKRLTGDKYRLVYLLPVLVELVTGSSVNTRYIAASLSSILETLSSEKNILTEDILKGTLQLISQCSTELQGQQVLLRREGWSEWFGQQILRKESSLRLYQLNILNSILHLNPPKGLNAILGVWNVRFSDLTNLVCDSLPDKSMASLAISLLFDLSVYFKPNRSMKLVQNPESQLSEWATSHNTRLIVSTLVRRSKSGDEVVFQQCLATYYNFLSARKAVSHDDFSRDNQTNELFPALFDLNRTGKLGWKLVSRFATVEPDLLFTYITSAKVSFQDMMTAEMIKYASEENKDPETIADVFQVLSIWLRHSSSHLELWNGYKEGVQCMVTCLESSLSWKEDTARFLGNLALCISECAIHQKLRDTLVDAGITKWLILHLRVVKDGGARKNLGIACARLCQNSKALQVVRSMQGMELLYTVGKNL